MMRWITWCFVAAVLIGACVPIQPVEEVAGEEQVAPVPVQEDPAWSEYTAPGLSIWLPSDFVGGDLERDLPVIEEMLRNAGAEYAAFADALAQNRNAILFLAIDSQSLESGNMANVLVGREPVLSVVTSEVYMEAMTNMLPEAYEILEQGPISHPAYEDAGRVITSMTLPGAQTVKQAIYVLNDGANTVWSIAYSAPESTFDEMLPTFERSADTFTTTEE